MTGPRWIAESVAVALKESAPTLEQEMELASAAKVAAETARNDFASATAVEVQAPVPMVEVVEPAVAAAASVGEAVANTESVPAPAVAETVLAESSLVQSAEPDVPKEESAFAAAAAAGSSSDHAPTMEALSSATVSPEISASAPVASVEVAPQREAELAAAWQNWKQIRESFVSAQPPAPVAEAPAAEASTPQEEAPAPADPAEAEAETAEVEAAPSEAPGESTAIASIVDTMLAELRPKLVEEIAKKMNSEKKEKEKEKEKKKRK
jgi:hypothetical protein